MEMSRTPPQRFVQEARCLNLNFLGGFFLREESTDSSSALFSETSSQIDTAVVFSGRTLDSSVQPRAQKHLQQRRESRSNPRAWLTATCLGGQLSTGSDLRSVSLHFRFHLYRDFQEPTCFTSRVPTHCVDLNLP